MKLLIHIFLLAVFIAFAVQSKAQKVCVELAKQQSSLQCEQIVLPVCGCNGLTFPNSCVAGKSGVENYTIGKCKQTDSIKQASISYLTSGCLPFIKSDSLSLKFDADSLHISGALRLPTCNTGKLFYSIGTHDIIIFSDSTEKTCSDSCWRAISFTIPAKIASWYHILFASHLDTVFYVKPPVIQSDTVDFTTGACLTATTKSQLTGTYNNGSVLLRGIAQMNCCSAGKIYYSVFRSVIHLQAIDDVACTCHCAYPFECRIANLNPGLYRVVGVGFDTLLQIVSPVVANPNFTLSSDSIVIQKGQNIILTINCADVSGFLLRNDNLTSIDARMFGKDVIVRGLQLGSAILRITNPAGLEKICKLSVVDQTSQISFVDSVLKLKLSQQTYLLKYNESQLVAPIIWRSTNSRVASVDENGSLSLLSAGTTQIIANILNTNKSDTCQVIVSSTTQNTVFNILSTSHSIVAALDTTLTLGETRQLSVVWYQTQQAQNIKWISLNTDVVKIDPNGDLLAVGLGSAKIVATIESLSNSDTVSFWVVSQAYVHSRSYHSNNQVKMSFSKEIASFSDSIQNWSLRVVDSNLVYYPYSIENDYNYDIVLRFSDMPNSYLESYVQVNKNGAVLFNDNSILLKGEYSCYSMMPTAVKQMDNNMHFWYYNKNLYFDADVVPAMLTIYSIDGTSVLQTAVQHNRLDISQLSAGSYIVQLSSSLYTQALFIVVSSF